MARVFVSDKLDAGGLKLLEQSGLEVDTRTGLKGAELQEAIRSTDALIVRSGTKVTAELLQEPGKLRAIIRAERSSSGWPRMKPCLGPCGRLRRARHPGDRICGTCKRVRTVDDADSPSLYLGGVSVDGDAA